VKLTKEETRQEKGRRDPSAEEVSEDDHTDERERERECVCVCH
jgi:hypothetical protein